MDSIQDSAVAIAWLRTPAAIRVRCGALFDYVGRGDSEHFILDPARMTDAAAFVAATIRDNYPDLAVPVHSRWRHFDVGGVDRWARIEAGHDFASHAERARTRIDLAVTSVLLDAGAGVGWRYREAETEAEFARSEGLAVASLNLFAGGGLSGDPENPLRADAVALKRLDGAALAAAFQVTDANPIVGLGGRAALLRRLGQALQSAPELFGSRPARIGNLYDFLAGRAAGGALEATEILDALLRGLAPIWPSRIEIDGVNLGDVWRHRAIRADDATDGLLPFHKLSQWLAYSLVEPLQESGLTVVGLEALTGLAEYRNGGLFVDLGVVVPRDEALLRAAHEVGAEAIVEWRALTVALLDRIAVPVSAALGVDEGAMPLASILEGGTWWAGRRIAAQRRADGGPPIHVISDGTVF